MSTRDFTPILLGVLSAASSAINEEGRPVGRVELTPGNLPAWDDCCSGQLYLRVIEVFPSAGIGSGFPTFDSAQRGTSARCSIHLLNVHIGLGIIRCAHTVKDDLNAPTPEEVSADGEAMLADMQTLLDVILCDLQNEVKGILQLKLDRWTPQGVQGGCHGGEWGVHLAIDPCVSCD